MKLITFAGPPSSGKTSVIIRTIECLKQEFSFGVIKFDCLSSFDNLLYEKYNIPVRIGLSGNLCPDHFFISNIESGLQWGLTVRIRRPHYRKRGIVQPLFPSYQGSPGGVHYRQPFRHQYAEKNRPDAAVCGRCGHHKGRYRFAG